MQIFIQRGDEQFGPYTPEQIQDFLEEGSVTESDLGWYEGQNEWKPLSSLFEIERTAQAPPPPSPLPAQGSGPSRKKRSVAEKIFWTVFLGGGSLFALSLIAFYSAENQREMESEASQRTSYSRERSQTRSVQSPPKSRLADEVVEVDLYNLQETHSGNSLFFEESYRGKTLRVTGQIAKIDRNLSTKAPYVDLQAPIGGQKFFHKLAVVFDDASLAAKLATGSIITVVGRADGLNNMSRPQLGHALLEATHSPMEPYPGILWEQEGETRRPISADSPQAIHAAKLFAILLKNPLLGTSLGDPRNHKLAEMIKSESRGNQTLFRIGMYFGGDRNAQTIYAWVMVTENPDGSFETPPEGHFLGDFGVLCGSETERIQAYLRIRKAHAWDP